MEVEVERGYPSWPRRSKPMVNTFPENVSAPQEVEPQVMLTMWSGVFSFCRETVSRSRAATSPDRPNVSDGLRRNEKER